MITYLTENVPHILWYAALVGLVVLLLEHLIDRAKEPIQRRTGLR